MENTWNPVVYRVTIPDHSVANLQSGYIHDKLGLQTIQIGSMPDGSVFMRFYTSFGPTTEEEAGKYKDRLSRYIWADGKPVIDTETEENGGYTIIKRPDGIYKQFLIKFEYPKAVVPLSADF